jgi:IS5 family transposase
VLILKATVVAGLKSKTIKPAHLKRISVDTTVQEKAVSFPTDSKLLNRSRIRLVKLCRQNGVVLRQSYARKGPRTVFKTNRYVHARQFRRMRSRVKKLRTYLGRVVRYIERKIANPTAYWDAIT